MRAKRVILYIDAAEPRASGRRFMLATHGYRVLAAASGAEALACFARGERVDLVVADLHLDDLADVDGKTLIAQIKNLAPRTPAILFSSRVVDYEYVSSADAFLPKMACSADDLLYRIKLLTARKRAPYSRAAQPATSRDALGESPYMDICGYGILGAALHQSPKTEEQKVVARKGISPSVPETGVREPGRNEPQPLLQPEVLHGRLSHPAPTQAQTGVVPALRQAYRQKRPSTQAVKR